MNFPTVTIPDPAAVGRWLDQEQPAASAHSVSYIRGKFFSIHWLPGNTPIDAYGSNPDALLADIRAKLAELDPLAKLRKDAEAHGYELTPKAP